MTYDNIGGAITSYLLAFGALMVDIGVVGALGAALLVVRLCYEGIRLYRYVRFGEQKDK